MASPQHVPHYKLVVLGAGGVGKTALIVQFVQRRFVVDYDPTIEDSYVKQCAVDGVTCKVELMDTAGQEEFTAMREQYLRSGQGFMLIFSVVDRHSLDHLVGLYKQILRVKDRDDFPMILVANKVDLMSERCVSKVDGENLSKRLSVPYFELSAKGRHNVDDSFFELIRLVRNFNAREMASSKFRAGRLPKRKCCIS